MLSAKEMSSLANVISQILEELEDDSATYAQAYQAISKIVEAAYARNDDMLRLWSDQKKTPDWREIFDEDYGL